MQEETLLTNIQVMPVLGAYEQLDVRYDPEARAAWYYLNTKPLPCFNEQVLGELRRFQVRAARLASSKHPDKSASTIEYLILASSISGVFNYGGDLRLFVNLIKARNREALLRYARACIDVLYPNAVGLGAGLTTISLVQGDALGGGCEAALSSHVIIAEESAKFGLPEVLFNLVPGMGAYSILSRRISSAGAERIIMGGELHTASEFHELGLVDVVAPDGEGERVVAEFMRSHRKRRNAQGALCRIRERVNPMSYEELIDVTEIWVEAALKLEGRDLRMMERLARAQARNTPQVGDSGVCLEREA